MQRGLYVEHGGQPGNGLAWTDDDANRMTNGFFHDTWDTLRQAYVRPRHSGFVNFQEAAGRAIHGLLRGENTVDGCLRELIDLYALNLPRA